MLLQLGQTDCWLTLGDSEKSFPLSLHWRQWDFVKVCFVSEIYTKICIVCQTTQLHLKLKPFKKNYFTNKYSTTFFEFCQYFNQEFRNVDIENPNPSAID